MEVLYPSFLPRVPHELNVDDDDEAWLKQKEDEQQERRDAMCKLDNFPKPIGTKDTAEQNDTVELGEDEDEEDEDEGELEDDEIEEEGSNGGDFMEEGDSLRSMGQPQSDLDMSVG
eukprot:Phypoly_transcript_23042.p2 GENE.Phypoly_transcript_23042~~Phypoly_transcript_23042.p2  ORF type:complete len:116 (+),score=43.20 Phypoly_transcript_23042:118-465(+)